MAPSDTPPADLVRLAELYGISASYSPAPGRVVVASSVALVRVLAALGVEAGTSGEVRVALGVRERELRERVLPATVVWWEGEAGPVLPEGEVRVVTESGEVRREIAQLPLGVHQLEVRCPDGRVGAAHLVVAPRRLPAPVGRSYGVLVQLYSLLSRRSWGMGDLGDLKELAEWAGRVLGAGFVQVNPLHAGVPEVPADPSPYRPSSRRFPDPVHLRVEEIPEFAYVPQGGQLLERGAELRQAVLQGGELIDRDAVWALKKEALEAVVRVPLGPGRAAAYRDFVAERGNALEDHATWCALAEAHGVDWASWPERLRDPRSAETACARRELADRVEFYRRLAWLVDAQLAEVQRSAVAAGGAGAARADTADGVVQKGMPIGVVHDLAVGVHPGGADAWAQQEFFAAGMSIGAPPDAFNSLGQDWGLPPWRPDRLARAGYAPFRELLRGLFRYAGALRIDHVMGLFRLWWVPAGGAPVDGAYVRYDAEAMLAVLVLEASRAGALVIGEDLGTVEPGVREALRRRGVLGTSVLWFERDWEGDGRPVPAGEWRAGCLATATTHDLPSTAARLSGDDVELRHRLGLARGSLAEERAAAAEEVGEWLAVLDGTGGDPGLDGTGGTPGLDGTDGAAGADGSGGDPGSNGTGGTPAPALASGDTGTPAPSYTGAAAPGNTGTATEEAHIQAVYRYLARTPAALVGLWLPDTVGDRRPQNLPGTWNEYPNWRLPIADGKGRPVTLEELAAAPRVHALAAVLRNRPAETS